MGHSAIPDDKHAEVWACYASATFPNEKFLRIGRLLASRCWKKRNPTEGKHAFLGVRIDVMFFRKSPLSSTFYVYIWCGASFLLEGQRVPGVWCMSPTLPEIIHPQTFYGKDDTIKRHQLEEAGFFSDINFVFLYIYICCLGIFGDPWIKTYQNHFGVVFFQKKIHHL